MKPDSKTPNFPETDEFALQKEKDAKALLKARINEFHLQVAGTQGIVLENAVGAKYSKKLSIDDYYRKYVTRLWGTFNATQFNVLNLNTVFNFVRNAARNQAEKPASQMAVETAPVNASAPRLALDGGEEIEGGK